MQRVTFKEYGVTGKKTGICPKCKRKASRSKRFWQTQNPFNKNDHGDTKSVDEILKENSQELKAWKKKPVFHAKCED